MPLVLTIRNVSELANGSPVSLTLDRRGAMVGRASTADWCLPDPALHISSRHFEIRFEGDQYQLIDHSTNGTFLFGESARLGAPRTISQGDVFLVGEFEIEASLDEASAAALAAQRAATDKVEGWKGWQAAGGGPQSPPAATDPSTGEAPGWGPATPAPSPSGGASGWGPPVGAPPPPPAASGGWGSATDSAPAGGSSDWGPSGASGGPAPAPSPSSGWGPSGGTPAPSPAPVPSPASGWGATGEAAAPATPAGQGWGSGNSGAKDSEGRNVSSPWNAAQGEQAQQASGWSSAASQDIPSGSNDIWGKIAQSNVVDWARGGFGNAPAPAPAPPPRPSGSVAAANFIPPTPQAPENTTQPPTAAPPPASPPPPPPQAAPDGQALLALAQAAGVDPDKLSHGEQETLGVAGDLLRRLVSGLVVMLEARARAKAQLGAQGTSLEFDGNNPLKFARSPEQALAQLLNPPERGFMPTERAIEDAFKDLQAHQMATLMAMQGALRATLERFSPDSIRSRAENNGMLAKVLPTARDAELWKAYEKEFSGVAKGSDEAFMDVFAKEFKKAYEEVAKSR